MYKVIQAVSAQEFEKELNRWSKEGYGLYHSHINLDGHVFFYTAILIKGFGKPEEPYTEERK